MVASLFYRKNPFGHVFGIYDFMKRKSDNQKQPATSGKGKDPNRWFAENNDEKVSMELDPHIFTSTDPKKIAVALKYSVEKGLGKKNNPFQSAMSLLTFYINRTGKRLNETEMVTLEKARLELLRLFSSAEGNLG